MNVQINYNNSLSKKKHTNKLFFVDESLNIQPLKKFILSREYSYVSDLLKKVDNKKKISLFEFSSSQSITLIKLKKNIKNYEIENLGGEFFNYIKELKKKKFTINSDSISVKIKNLIE